MLEAQAFSALERLRANRDFRKLWAGQTISVFGSLITRLALPFTAVLYLKATPGQMATLAAADLLPGFVVGLFAGAWVDRLPRRPVLIVTDLLRAALLITIPVAAMLHALSLAHLFVVALLGGALTTLFDVAWGAYLPRLVAADELTDANSRLSASTALASACSFALSGWLVQAFTGPHALLLDALTFLVSAAFLIGIQRPERPDQAATHEENADEPDSTHLLQEVGQGLQVVWHHPLLRPLAITTTLLHFGFMLFGALFILFVTRELHLAPGVQGMVYAIGGVTATAGAALAPRITQRLGVGRTMLGSLTVAILGTAAVPIARGNGAQSIACLALNQCFTDPGYAVFEVNETALRQTAVPDRFRGRVNGTFRVCVMGAMLLGTLGSGIGAERFGIRAVMIVGTVTMLLGALVLTLSPSVRCLRTVEEAGATVGDAEAGGR